MAELKTKQNNASVIDFLNTVEGEKRREDAFEIGKTITEGIG